MIGIKTTFSCCHRQENAHFRSSACHKIAHIFSEFEEPHLKNTNTSSFCTLYRCLHSNSVSSGNDADNKCYTNFSPNCGENFIVALPVFAIKHIYRIMNKLEISKCAGMFIQFDETQLDFEQDTQEVSPDELFKITSFFNLHKTVDKFETTPCDYRDCTETNAMRKTFVVFDNSDSFVYMLKNGKLEMTNPFSDLFYSINILSVYNFVQKLCGIESVTNMNQLNKSKLRPTKRYFTFMNKYKPDFYLDQLIEENEQSSFEDVHSLEEDSVMSFPKSEENESETSEDGIFLENIIANIKERGKFINVNKSNKGISKSRRNRNMKVSTNIYNVGTTSEKERQEQMVDYPTKLVSGENAPISDSYYGQLTDLNEIDARPIELMRGLDNKILSQDSLDIHPFSLHTASLQRLIDSRKSTGVMTFNDLRDLHLNTDGIFETTYIDNPPVEPDMKIYTNPRARTRLPSGNNAQLGYRSHKLFDSYIHKLNTLKVQDEIAKRMSDTEDRLSQEKKTIILKKWDLDSIGFIPFVILINANSC